MTAISDRAFQSQYVVSGGLVPIATVTVTGSGQASVTFANIPQGYADLVLVYSARDTSATDSDDLHWQANGDTGANYDGVNINAIGSTLAAAQAGSSTSALGGASCGANAPANAFSVGVLTFPNYTGTTAAKTSLGHARAYRATSANTFLLYETGGFWNGTAAISSLSLTCGGTFVAGSVFTLYGRGGTSALPVAVSTSALVPIAEVVLTGSQASVTFSNIPQTYRHLLLQYQARSDAATTSTAVQMTCNGDSGANYAYATRYGNAANSDVSISGSTSATAVETSSLPAASAAANYATSAEVLLHNYANTTFTKSTVSRDATPYTTASFYTEQGSGQWRNTSAITSLMLAPASGNFVAGSIFTLYGIAGPGQIPAPVQVNHVTTQTANYQMAQTDDFVLADATAGTITITLPSALVMNKPVTVKRIDASMNSVLVSAQTGQSIDGSGGVSLSQKGEAITVIPASGTWWLV